MAGGAFYGLCRIVLNTLSLHGKVPRRQVVNNLLYLPHCYLKMAKHTSFDINNNAGRRERHVYK